VTRSPRLGFAVLGLVVPMFLFGTAATTDTAASPALAVASTSQATPPPEADNWRGTLLPGQAVRDEAAGGNRLVHQHDGNVVIYNVEGRALWSSRTQGTRTTRLVMQDDGNLVLYNGTTPVFQSKTAGTGATLTLQGDANAVLYAPEPHVKWAARHWPPKPAPSASHDYACGGDLPPCYVLKRESGGDLRIWNGGCYAPYGYRGTSPCGTSSASGKWQFVRGTWNGYGGYVNAADAPAHLQNAKARELWAGGRGCSHWAAC
jgi:hypothetical protein